MGHPLHGYVHFISKIWIWFEWYIMGNTDAMVAEVAPRPHYATTMASLLFIQCLERDTKEG